MSSAISSVVVILESIKPRVTFTLYLFLEILWNNRSNFFFNPLQSPWRMGLWVYISKEPLKNQLNLHTPSFSISGFEGWSSCSSPIVFLYGPSPAQLLLVAKHNNMYFFFDRKRSIRSTSGFSCIYANGALALHLCTMSVSHWMINLQLSRLNV